MPTPKLSLCLPSTTEIHKVIDPSSRGMRGCVAAHKLLHKRLPPMSCIGTGLAAKAQPRRERCCSTAELSLNLSCPFPSYSLWEYELWPVKSWPFVHRMIQVHILKAVRKATYPAAPSQTQEIKTHYKKFDKAPETNLFFHLLE